MSGDETDRLSRLEARVEELEALQQLLVRLMSTTRPLSDVLERWGATETQEQALYHEICTPTCAISVGRHGKHEKFGNLVIW